MTYNEKLTKLASDYGVDGDTYFNMIKNEVVIEGLMWWAVIIIGFIVLIGCIVYMNYCNKKEDYSAIADFLIPITFFIVVGNLFMFFVTDFYTDPLSKTFNTNYEVVKKIDEMDIE